MTARARANGEGSIYAYRNGYAAYAWVTTPAGLRQRKYVYGQTREVVHAKWLDLHRQAARGPVASRVPTLDAYLTYWLTQIVRPNLAPATASSYEMFARLYVNPCPETVGSTSSACATCRPGSDRSGTAASAAHRARNSPESSHAVAPQAPVATRSHRRAPCAMPGQPCGSCSATPSVRSCSRATSRGWCGFPRSHKPKPWSVEEARRFLESPEGQRPALRRLRTDPGPGSASRRSARPGLGRGRHRLR